MHLTSIHYFIHAFHLQAQDNIMNLPLANGWGEKHRLFVKWKYIEAKVCVSSPQLFVSSYLIIMNFFIIVQLEWNFVVTGCLLLINADEVSNASINQWSTR